MLRAMPVYAGWRRDSQHYWRWRASCETALLSGSETGSKPAMKLMWFHLMPYTELPEDFKEKHPSVWVDIHSSLFDPKRAHLMYNDFMDELEYAADLGYDAICLNEHHSNGYGLMLVHADRVIAE